MKKYIISLFLILGLIICITYKMTSNNWYNPQKMINNIGNTKEETLTNLGIKENELVEGIGGMWKIPKSAKIEGFDFSVNLAFDTSQENEPFYQISYIYSSDVSEIDKAFTNAKKMANILTKNYGEPYTEAIYIGTSQTLAKLTSLKDAKDNREYHDTWMLENRMKTGVYKNRRIQCNLAFTKAETGSITILTYIIYIPAAEFGKAVQ